MWEKIYTFYQQQTGAAFPLNYEFSESILVISAKAGNSRIDWHRAGVLYPFLTISEIGKVQSKSINLKLGNQLIQVYNPGNYNFTAEFQLVDYLIDIKLDFWINPEVTAVESTKNIENILRRIEYKVDAIETYGNQ